MNADKVQTIVGKTVTVKGEIIGQESLTIEGRVEGKIQLENSIYVRESGVVNADISSQSITIAGSVSGNIVATDKVEILRGGIMLGDIKSPRVVVNDGANLKGHVEMDVTEEKITAKQKAVIESPASSLELSSTYESAASTSSSSRSSEDDEPEAEEVRGRKSFSGLLTRK